MALAPVPDLAEFPQQTALFPGSRYMGSKQALLPFLHAAFSAIEFETALDGFSGSGVVSYLLKAMGKQVHSNDFLALGYHTANALIANDNVRLTPDEITNIQNVQPLDGFVSQTFKGMYFSDEENQFLDAAVTKIREEENEIRRSLLLTSIARACQKRRPRGLFTYTGTRYVDGRPDLKTSLREHFGIAARSLNQATFETRRNCMAHHSDIFELPPLDVDLVYLDPPYVSSHSDNDYTRRYHFVEGLVREWKGLQIQHETTTKKFRRLPSRFDSKTTVYQAFDDLFRMWAKSKIVLSYSSNGIPSKDEIVEILSRYKKTVRVLEQGHRYSFGNQGHSVAKNKNAVTEYLFIGE